MSYKKGILNRIRIVFILLCGLGFLIIQKAYKIQHYEGDYWREQGAAFNRIDTIEGDRGNLYSANGRLLATSLPLFEIRMDMTITKDTLFKNQIASLAEAMSLKFNDFLPEEYEEILRAGRKKDNRYLLIRKEVNYNELQEIKTWPILKHGRFKGGLIIKQINKRVRPFDLLAKRTLGYTRTNAQHVGLEGRFNNYLKGTKAPQSMQKVSGGEWVPIYDDFEIDVKNGKDLYTTIDVNMQDIVENALLEGLHKHKANHGCAILMEVKTGQIKAIANLGANSKKDGYLEKYNYAIGEKIEHGSTFKVAALTTLLEHGYVTENTIIDIEGGKKTYYDTEMLDSKWHPESQISISKIIEISSNVGISKPVFEFYKGQPHKFIQQLEDMHLSRTTRIEIKGEAQPNIKRPGDPDWSGVTLPWMAIGYEIELTPLQLLNFYNAIANRGKMMKPYLVTEVKEMNETVDRFYPKVLNEQICKPETAETVMRLLRNVVEGKNGTAKMVKSNYVSIAAKTGTAQIARGTKGYKEAYQASIAGFFPADNPVYSCIVVINRPSAGQYYGGTVAGPVFKEIVEKCYAIDVKTHEAINKEKHGLLAAAQIPPANNGYQKDIQTIYNEIGISNAPTTGVDWVVPNKSAQSVYLNQLPMVDNLIPNVTGMGLRDAIYILENIGMRVQFTGKGKIRKQSPMYGTRYKRGEKIVLVLE